MAYQIVGFINADIEINIEILKTKVDT